MEIVYILLGLIIVVVLLGYSSHKKELTERTTAEGGMQNKYSELIRGLLHDDPQSQIFKTTGTSIELGVKNVSGSIKFKIRQDVNTVFVEYQLSTHNQSSRRLAWEFPDSLTQTEMINKIRLDIATDNLKHWGVL
ncbi:MAG: hypothetical protein JXQ26_09265 [Tissierellales bacterium]|nr:hypothetical protein [Tissierellales bacterium]